MANNKKKAIIIAMAAMVGTSTEAIRDAAAAALRDIKHDLGANMTFTAQDDPFVNYTWDPSDGELA